MPEEIISSSSSTSTSSTSISVNGETKEYSHSFKSNGEIDAKRLIDNDEHQNYYINENDKDVEIADQGGFDKIHLLNVSDASALTFKVDGDNLIITGGETTITVKGQFSEDGAVEKLYLASGESIDISSHDAIAALNGEPKADEKADDKAEEKADANAKSEDETPEDKAESDQKPEEEPKADKTEKIESSEEQAKDQSEQKASKDEDCDEYYAQEGSKEEGAEKDSVEPADYAAPANDMIHEAIEAIEDIQNDMSDTSIDMPDSSFHEDITQRMDEIRESILDSFDSHPDFAETQDAIDGFIAIKGPDSLHIESRFTAESDGTRSETETGANFDVEYFDNLFDHDFFGGDNGSFL